MQQVLASFEELLTQAMAAPRSEVLLHLDDYDQRPEWDEKLGVLSYELAAVARLLACKAEALEQWYQQGRREIRQRLHPLLVSGHKEPFAQANRDLDLEKEDREEELAIAGLLFARALRHELNIKGTATSSFRIWRGGEVTKGPEPLEQTVGMSLTLIGLTGDAVHDEALVDAVLGDLFAPTRGGRFQGHPG